MVVTVTLVATHPSRRVIVIRDDQHSCPSGCKVFRLLHIVTFSARHSIAVVFAHHPLQNLPYRSMYRRLLTLLAPLYTSP